MKAYIIYSWRVIKGTKKHRICGLDYAGTVKWRHKCRLTRRMPLYMGYQQNVNVYFALIAQIRNQVDKERYYIAYFQGKPELREDE